MAAETEAGVQLEVIADMDEKLVLTSFASAVQIPSNVASACVISLFFFGAVG